MLLFTRFMPSIPSEQGAAKFFGWAGYCKTAQKKEKIYLAERETEFFLIMDFNSFIKKHGRMINNIAVVTAVLIAVYVKIGDEEATTPFTVNDVFFIVGAFLAFGLLIMIKNKNKNG